MNPKMMGNMIDNVGIMQGFLEGLDRDDDDDTDEVEEERSPDSPEIIMNNLRGDMRSVDARVDELADLVGYRAAAETPMEVLALLQPVLAQGGIGGLPGAAPAAAGAQPPMMPPPGMMPPGMPPPPGTPPGGIAGMPGGAPPGMPPGPPPGMPPGPPGAGPAGPVPMARGGLVQRFSDGSDEEGVTQADTRDDMPRMPSEAAARLLDPQTKAALRAEYLRLLAPRTAAPVPTLEAAMQARVPEYERLLGDTRSMAQGQVLLDLAQRAFGYAANVDEQGRPLGGSQASRMLAAFRGVPGTLAAAGAEISKAERATKLAALQAAEKDIAAAQARTARGEQARETAILNAARSGMLIESREDLAAKAAESAERLTELRANAANYRVELQAATRERIAAEDRAARENTEKARQEAATARQREADLNRRLISTERNATQVEIAEAKNISQQSIQQAKDAAAMARTELRAATQERIAADNRASREQTAEAIQAAIDARQREAIAATDARAAENRANALTIADRRGQSAVDVQLLRNQGRAFAGNWFMPTVTDPALARAFASGNTDEATEAKINAAIVAYTRPVTTNRTDERGNLVTTSTQAPLPSFWQNAYRTRGIPVPTYQSTSVTASGAAGLPPLPGTTEGPTGQLPAIPGGAAAAPVAAPAAPAPGAAAVPGAEDQAPAIVRPVAPPSTRRTLWDAAESMTGPVAAAKDAISAIPGFGFVGAEDRAVRRQAMADTESLIEAALKNPRAPIDEQRRLREIVNVGPTISDVNRYRSNLLGISQTLFNEYQGARQDLSNPESTRDIRNAARAKALAASKLLERVAPPIYDRETFEAVKPMLQPGMHFLFLDDSGVLRPGRVPTPRR